MFIECPFNEGWLPLWESLWQPGLVGLHPKFVKKPMGSANYQVFEVHGSRDPW
jgi:hypothetical protein